jgi:hypothetical protein
VINLEKIRLAINQFASKLISCLSNLKILEQVSSEEISITKAGVYNSRNFGILVSSFGSSYQKIVIFQEFMFINCQLFKIYIKVLIF